MENSRQRGLKGEDYACDYLKKKYYKILKRNFRFRCFEVDIIAMKDEVLHGIEVKTWACADVDDLECSVDFAKLKRVADSLQSFAFSRAIDFEALQIDSLFIDAVTKEVHFFEDVYQEDAHAAICRRKRRRTPI